MTFFLLGYAIGLKENIKSVMRTFMIATCVFVFYTSAVHAQLIKSDSEIVNTMNRLVAMQSQTKWEDSSAFAEGNLTFFQGFIKQLDFLPIKDHHRMLTYTIEQLEKLTDKEAKKKYGIEKNIVVSVLKGIVAMVKNDAYETDNGGGSAEEKGSQTSSSNALYTLTTSKVNGVTYTVYTLKKPQTIKYADFQDEQGSYIHCLYEQCNRISFTDRLPKTLQVQYILGGKTERINLQKNVHSVNSEDETVSSSTTQDALSNKKEEKTDTQSMSSQQSDSEDDLLGEINDIFGGIF